MKFKPMIQTRGLNSSIKSASLIRNIRTELIAVRTDLMILVANVTNEKAMKHKWLCRVLSKIEENLINVNPLTSINRTHFSIGKYNGKFIETQTACFAVSDLLFFRW